MSSINIQTLSQSLEKKFKVMGIAKARKHAIKLSAELSDIAGKWKANIYKKLTKPATSRGLFKKSKTWLALHDKHSYNKSFPMLMSGMLRASIYASVSYRETPQGASIEVSRGFHELSTGEVGGYRDYGDYLNEKHSLLAGWKERAYAKLDSRIRTITRIRHE